MTRSELLTIHDELTEESKDLMVKKNADYAKSSDPFRNFRRHGLTGMIVRMDDKISRMTTFSEKGSLSVKDESIRDTVLDMINYAVLFYAYVLDMQEDFRAKEIRQEYLPEGDYGVVREAMEQPDGFAGTCIDVTGYGKKD